MNRFSGWMRGSAVAALMVLSTGACAQRVPLPPGQVVAQAPVVRQALPSPPVARAPVPVAAPVAVAPAPRRRIAPPPVAPRPAPPPQDARRSAPPPSGPATAEAAREPVAPRVASTAPPSFGGRFRATEVASDDYGSTQGGNPTPDAAPGGESFRSDAPPAPPETRVAAQPRPPAPPAEPTSLADDTLSALASLFGADTPPSAPEPTRAAPVQVASLETNPGQTPPEQNPYPGGFDDDNAYDTAQVYQQPVYQQPVYQQPVYQEPVYQEPVYQEPVYQEPTYGYAPAAPPPPPVARFDPAAPITVAILTPDTDSRPSIRALAKGLSQAAALSARTLGNRQLVLRGYDTGGTPEKARLAAQQAISDGAQLIVGPLFSSSASAVAPVAQGAGVPVIAFTTDTGVLGNGLYSVGYLPDAEVERMLSFAAGRGIRKIGLLSPDTPYGGIVFRTVQNAASGYGVEVATVQPIGSDFSQAAATGERFADFYKSAPDTDGVLIATNGKPLQGIAAYLAYNDVLPSKVQYMGLGTWDDAETFREATLVGGWFPGLDPALKAEFEGRYSGAYGEKPPAIATLAYDGIAIAGALIQQAQSTGQPPFTRQAIENPTGFRGMSGLFRLLPDGRNQRLLSILKVGRRQFEMLDPAPTAFSQRMTSITGYDP